MKGIKHLLDPLVDLDFGLTNRYFSLSLLFTWWQKRSPASRTFRRRTKSRRQGCKRTLMLVRSGLSLTVAVLMSRTRSISVQGTTEDESAQLGLHLISASAVERSYARMVYGSTECVLFRWNQNRKIEMKLTITWLFYQNMQSNLRWLSCSQ